MHISSFVIVVLFIRNNEWYPGRDLILQTVVSRLSCRLCNIQIDYFLIKNTAAEKWIILKTPDTLSGSA